MKFTTTSSSLGTNFPKPPNDPTTSLPFSEYSATNVMTDKNGGLLFYVISTRTNTFIIDRNNKIAKTLNTRGKEIGIVPIDEGVRYHILVGGQIVEYNLAKEEFDEFGNLNFGNVLLVRGDKNNFHESVFAIRLKHDNTTGCLSGYYCYSLLANDNGYTSRKIKITEYTKSRYDNTIQNFSQTDFDITTIANIATSFSYYVSEMDLSADGSLLSLADDQKVWVFDINPSTGKFVGYSKSSIYNNNGSNPAVAGLEFTGDNNLVYSVFESSALTSTVDAVYHWNLTTNAVNTFASSSSYARSAIEMSKNGELIVAKANGLYKLNLAGLTISPFSSSIAIHKNIDLYNYYFSPTTSYFGIYNLNDQIDGQNIELLDLDETVFAYKFGVSPTGSFNWSNASHGLTKKGSGRVLVLNSITVGAGTSPVVMDGMTIDFYNEAQFNIYPKASVTLKGTYLKGASCGLMWAGINMLKGKGPNATATNTLVLQKNTLGTNSRIMDAYIGVKTNSAYNILNIKEESNLSRNEINVQISSNDLNRISLANSFFIGDLPLRDQYRGSANLYFNDNKRRTISNIMVINGNVKIGDNITTNNIKGGQYGINAIGSSVQILKANIYENKQYGCLLDANRQANKSVIIENCTIHDLQQGVRIAGEMATANITKNNIYNTLAYGIQYLGNHGGKLTVGDETNPALGNTFNNCNWAAVECFDNAKYIKPTAQIPNPPDLLNSKIIIANNSINNQSYATGVSVGEPVLATRSYGLMHLNVNKIGQLQRIGQGIVLRQIAGANIAKSQYSFGIPYNPAFTIDTNNVEFTNALQPFYNGVLAENSNGLNFIGNAINSNSYGDWRPNAIKMSEGKNSLVYYNVLHGGNGLQVTGNGMFSNYYCNRFNSCVNGIQLGWNFLRNKSTLNPTQHDDVKIHANLYPVNNNIIARPNNFDNTFLWGADINVYTNAVDRNQWDFVQNLKPVISYLAKPSTAPFEIAHNLNRKNPCVEISAGLVSPIGNNHVAFADIQDTVLQWKLKYGIMHDYFDASSDQWIADSSLLKLVKIESLIQKLNYNAALPELNFYFPTNSIELDFKTVYQIWVLNRLQNINTIIGTNAKIVDTVWTDSINYYIDTFSSDSAIYSINCAALNDSLVQILSNIAGQDAILKNPAAYPARAILWADRQLQFYDAPLQFYPNVTGYVTGSCLGGIDSGLFVGLFNNQDVYTGIGTKTTDSGFFLLNGQELKALDTTANYYLSTLLSDSSWINSSMATWHQLAFQSFNRLECAISSNPLLKNVTQTAQRIIVSPNPSADGFQLANMPQNWRLLVTSMDGRVVLEKFSAGNFSLNRLTTGIYMLTIEDLKNHAISHIKIIQY